MSYQNNMIANFDSRAEFEFLKKSDNVTMQKTLADMKKSVSHARIADIMQSCEVDENFINKQERVDSRFNVYAAEKVINFARYLASVQSLNHYTRAIVATLDSLERNDMHMTHDDAISACSLSCKSKDTSHEKHVIKYQSHVAASTASTQASSSLNTLLMYHVVIEERDMMNKRVYKLNRDNSVTLDLLTMLNLI